MVKKRNDDDGNEMEDDPIPTVQPPAAPDPWAVMGQLAQALENISRRLEAAPATSDATAQLMETQALLAKALDRVADSQMAGSQLIASETRRAHRPSNEVVPQISVFNRRGVLLPDYQKPKLKCIMMMPWLVEWESVTREEVELLNLLQAGEYTIKRIDNTKVRVTVQIDYRFDGKTPSRLVMNHDTAFNNDNFRLIPPFPDLLRQVLKQHEDPLIRAHAAGILSDEEEEALIEAGELTVSQ